ncbi:RHS repeat-associated core domain-containing protein, partial [Chryseobacterium sp. JK1]|uniref:RHS repeat-associated core domain-containing protein n=1 Tax=Chryseobacterium sp. JK1 TaxID=874294 RepID=UPI003D69EE3F
YLDGFQYYHNESSNNGGGGGLEELRMITEKLKYAYEQQAFSLENTANPPLETLKTTAKTPQLMFFPTAEGFYDYGKDQYIYQYKDHLGNTRISFGRNSVGALEITDSNDYYPFGMNHLKTGNAFFGQGTYKNYKYNGKELQETGMYDYGARFYMPDLGRWGVVDPLAETSRRWSPYNYAVNNPIRFIDPDGRSESDWFKNSLGQMEFRDDIKSQQDLTDKGVKGTYVGETAKEGDLSYAADGYIYDESSGGKPIADGRVYDVGEVVLNKTKWWNSPFARFLVPDRFGITQGGSVGGGAEIGTSMGLEVITRGKDAGVYFDPGNTLSLGVAFGAGGEGNLSFFSSTFTGKVSDMSLNSVVGTEAYVNGSLVSVVGVTGSVAVSFDPNPNNGPVAGRWVTRSVGIAAGAKGSAGVGVTISNTRVGVGFDGKIRVADYTGAVTGKGSY